MKKECLHFMRFLLLFFIMASCNKPKDVQTSLIGKWHLDSTQSWLYDYTNNRKYLETIYKPTADYYDYRNDGNLYRHYNNRYDTVTYTVINSNGNSLLKYGYYITDTIKTLNNHTLIMMNPQGGASKMFFTK